MNLSLLVNKLDKIYEDNILHLLCNLTLGYFPLDTSNSLVASLFIIAFLAMKFSFVFIYQQKLPLLQLYAYFFKPLKGILNSANKSLASSSVSSVLIIEIFI